MIKLRIDGELILCGLNCVDRIAGLIVQIGCGGRRSGHFLCGYSAGAINVSESMRVLLEFLDQLHLLLIVELHRVFHRSPSWSLDLGVELDSIV